MARINKSEPNHCDSKDYQSNLKIGLSMIVLSKNYVTNMLLWVKALYVSSLFSFRIIFVKNAYKRPEKLVQHPEAANKKIMTGALFCLQIDSWG